MTKTLKTTLNIPEPEIIEDHTNGRKPGKDEEIVMFRISVGNGWSKTAYKVIGKKHKKPKPLTAAEKKEIRESEKAMGMLGYDMLFGLGQGAGYYFH